MALEAILDAFDAGQKASLNGQPRSDNPHDPGDTFHVPPIWHAWDDGYDCNINQQLKAEVQRLTQQHEERESTIREQAARIAELIAATNDTDKPVVERQWETIWKLRDTAARLEAELKRLRAELPKSVDAVDPSAGTQERGPRAYEDL